MHVDPWVPGIGSVMGDVNNTQGVTNVSELNEEQFHLWQSLIEKRTGMHIPVQRQVFLQSSLRLRMKEINCDSFDAYYVQLQAGRESEQEWSILVDRLTVQETHFFRHPPSFELVSDKVREWFVNNTDKKSIQIWSVGCATGEEPYSLAMLLDEKIHAMHLAKDHYFGVTATDLSMPALDKARLGIYKSKKVEQQVSAAKRKRYFDYVDDKHVQIKPMIKERICFARINVLDLENVPFTDLDIIFCQNVLIYFSRWRRREIVNQLAKRLLPGGIIVLGLGEVMDWSHPQLVRVDSSQVLAFMKNEAGQEN